MSLLDNVNFELVSLLVQQACFTDERCSAYNIIYIKQLDYNNVCAIVNNSFRCENPVPFW